MRKNISWPVRIFIIAATLTVVLLKYPNLYYCILSPARTNTEIKPQSNQVSIRIPEYSVSKKELDEYCGLKILEKANQFDLKLRAFSKLKSEASCMGKSTQDCRVVFVSSEPLDTGYLCGSISNRFLSKSLPRLNTDETVIGGEPATIDIVSVDDIVVAATIWSKEAALISSDSLDPSQPIGRALLELGFLDGIKKWQRKDKKNSGILDGLRDTCRFSSPEKPELTLAAGYAISCIKLTSSTRISVVTEKLWWETQRRVAKGR